MQLMLPSSQVPEWRAAEMGGTEHAAVGMECTQVSNVQRCVLKKTWNSLFFMQSNKSKEALFHER